MSLQKALLEDGAKHGMCEKFQRILSGQELAIDELLMLYHRGLDFCIEHDWPGIDLVRLFSNDDLERNGIYYDRLGKFIANQFTVVNGSSDCTIVIPAWMVCSIYVRHNSRIRLIVEDNANCYVTTHDNSVVEVISKSPKSRLCASMYSCNSIASDKFDKVNYKNIK